MVSLHYFQAKTISSVSSKELKAECKRLCIPYEKNSSKNDLLRAIPTICMHPELVGRTLDIVHYLTAIHGDEKNFIQTDFKQNLVIKSKL